jgi:hypothetical protein
MRKEKKVSVGVTISPSLAKELEPVLRRHGVGFSSLLSAAGALLLGRPLAPRESAVEPMLRRALGMEAAPDGADVLRRLQLLEEELAESRIMSEGLVVTANAFEARVQVLEALLTEGIQINDGRIASLEQRLNVKENEAQRKILLDSLRKAKTNVKINASNHGRVKIGNIS